MKCENCTKYDDCRIGSGLTWPCGAYRPKAGSGTDIEKLIEQLNRYFEGEPLPCGAGTKEKERPSYMDLYCHLAAIEDILGDGYDLDRLRELVEADKDGRCVVLPCKFGDKVYFALFDRIIEKSVFSIVLFLNSERIYCNGTSEYFRLEDIGETVFLTREAAEKHREGEHNG